MSSTAARSLACVVLLCSWSGAGGQLSPADERGEQEFSEIAELLHVSEGQAVADVGAGGGLWTEHLARRVGVRGRVYATEVKQELVDGLRHSFRTQQLRQVTVVLGTELDTNLPEQCCDAVLLRLVYHAFDYPERMRASLRRALKPGGRLLVIDFRPPPAALRTDIEASGFEFVRVMPTWRDQHEIYAVLFRRSAN